MEILSVPSGLTPPLTVNNGMNHNGVIAIIASFALFMVIGSLAIRVYSAYSRRVKQLDDLTFATTVVLALAQISAIFVQIHFGWGKTKVLIPSKDLQRLKKTAYSADILYATILASSKASTALFYRAISLRSSRWMNYALLVMTILYGPISILLLAVRCGRYPWQHINGECKVLFTHWQAITAMDIVFEVILLLYPIRSIFRLQTSISKKATVIMVLSCRGLLIPIVAVHLHYIYQQIDSSDPTLEGIYATIVAELHVALSVAVLTAPLMKPFIAAYIDENGLAYTDDMSVSHPKPQLATHSGRLERRYTSSRLGEPLANNRIMKSIQFSVDREAVELPETH